MLRSKCLRAAAQPINGGVAPGMAPTRVPRGVSRFSGVYKNKKLRSVSADNKDARAFASLAPNSRTRQWSVRGDDPAPQTLRELRERAPLPSLESLQAPRIPIRCGTGTGFGWRQVVMVETSRRKQSRAENHGRNEIDKRDAGPHQRSRALLIL